MSSGRKLKGEGSRQTCSSRAPLNGSSYGDNDHSLPVSWMSAAFRLPARYYLTPQAIKPKDGQEKFRLQDQAKPA